MTAHRSTSAIVLVGLATAAGLAHGPTAGGLAPARAAAASLLPRSRVATMQESKITIRKPGSTTTGDSDSSGSSGGAKVSVRVRPKGEKKAAPPAAPSAASAEADDGMAVTVSVKTPANMTVAVPPPAPPSLETKNLTESDQLLLEGTTRANCTLMLDALQKGANPNVRDPKGRTPLHFVSGLGLAPAAVLLIHFGAQLDVKDGEGLTPMHMAAGYSNAQTLRVLAAAGANPDVPTERGTALQVVLQLGEYQLTQFNNRTAIQQRLKKKDDKLEELKSCMDVFDDIEKVKSDFDWDGALKEVLQTISSDTNAPSE